VLSANHIGVPTNECPQLSEGAVDLWIARYDAKHLGLEYDRLLSQDERARANRFKFAHDRNFYIFCRGSLRRILARYVPQSASSLEFIYGPAGKPSLMGESKLEFNASHSGNLFVCAVSSSLTLGIDVEEIRVIPDMLAVALHFFSPVENTHLARLDNFSRTRAFYECWTRKEAVIKATGEGITRPLDSFEVTFGPGVVARLRRFDSQDLPPCQMHTFEPQEGYIGALFSFSPWSAFQILTEKDLER
jgi:4'-phosphopantetheinyl transferase